LKADQPGRSTLTVFADGRQQTTMGHKRIKVMANKTVSIYEVERWIVSTKSHLRSADSQHVWDRTAFRDRFVSHLRRRHDTPAISVAKLAFFSVNIYRVLNLNMQWNRWSLS